MANVVRARTRAEGPKAVIPTRPTLVLVRHPLPMGEAIEAVGGGPDIGVGVHDNRRDDPSGHPRPAHVPRPFYQ